MIIQSATISGCYGSEAHQIFHSREEDDLRWQAHADHARRQEIWRYYGNNSKAHADVTQKLN